MFGSKTMLAVVATRRITTVFLEPLLLILSLALLQHLASNLGLTESNILIQMSRLQKSPFGLCNNLGATATTLMQLVLTTGRSA